ncbi:hypothetical protein AB205_0069630, partial [Aquarana catesbeiana]
PSLHQAFPAESLLTPGISSRVLLYIRCPQQSPSLHQVPPSEVPPYIRHSQQSPSLHQVSPAESLLTSGAPSRVPTYIRFPQQSPYLHQVPPAESLLTPGAPSRVPPYIRCPQQSPSLHQVSPASGVSPYIRCPQPAVEPGFRLFFLPCDSWSSVKWRPAEAETFYQCLSRPLAAAKKMGKSRFAGTFPRKQ